MAQLEAAAPAEDGQAFVSDHNLILPSEQCSNDQQSALAKLQAKFRGQRDRDTHVVRAREGKPVCPFVRTPVRAVRLMIELGRVGDADVVYDLGCGDGAITLGVAKHCRARCVGFDIDTVHLATARRNAREQGVDEGQVQFRSDDVLTLDMTEATVILIFLVPNMLQELLPKFAALPTGTRIIVFHFPLPEWEPTAVVDAEHPLQPPPAMTKLYAYEVR